MLFLKFAAGAGYPTYCYRRRRPLYRMLRGSSASVTFSGDLRRDADAMFELFLACIGVMETSYGAGGYAPIIGDNSGLFMRNF